MDTSNNDHTEEQEELEKKQAEERKRLQEKHLEENDEKRKGLQEDANDAHAETDAAQKAVLEEENQEKAANAKLKE